MESDFNVGLGNFSVKHVHEINYVNSKNILKKK